MSSIMASDSRTPAGMANHRREEDRVQLALSELVKTMGTAISDAHDVGEVTHALHSLASLLYAFDLEPTPGDYPFDVQLSQLASVCRNEVYRIFPHEDYREALRKLFYRGSSFSAMAKLLLFEVAADWLTCFSYIEQTHLFDSFFTFAPPSESLMALVPALIPTYNADEGDLSIETTSSVCGVAERLLVLCLIENGGLRKMAFDLASMNYDRGAMLTSSHFPGTNQSISTISQLIASIPDKARPKAPSSLHSPSFYLTTVSQLLEAANECWMLSTGSTDDNKQSFLFIGEVLARFCRRGHADIVASQMLRSLRHFIQNSFEGSHTQLNDEDLSDQAQGTSIYTNQRCSFWPMIMGSIRDVHAMERWTNALLQEMVHEQVDDWEAYWILYILFSGLIASQDNIRSLFTERFLLWKVLPMRCLKWILDFAVLCCPPGQSATNLASRNKRSRLQKDVVRHLVEVWAGENFVQSYDMQQQAYISAAVGLSLRGMTKEDLESSGYLLQALLQGISRRLESPLPLVRTMAKRVALAFSLVVDQAKPLLLDEDDKVEELLEWEQLDLDRPGVVKKQAIIDLPTSEIERKDEGFEHDMNAEPRYQQITNNVTGSKQKSRRKNKEDKPVLKAYDPDEVIDLGTYASDSYSDEDTASDVGSESSLQPYDLSDDESDLERDKFPMRLSECAANLRKGDQPDLVERALEVSERLVRARPDELENAAPDMAHALIHVRCSTIAIEGQEQSAEDKRQSALVALLVCAPQTVQVFTRELYSPHVDVSQRILILDVMSYAARELSTGFSLDSSAYGHDQQLIQEVGDAKWYGPGNKYTTGAGPWQEVNEPFAMVNLIRKYERELPQDINLRAVGKSRRWGLRSMLMRQKQRNQGRGVGKKNLFIPFAASFMLPVMRDYDKKRHGVDFLGRDFIVLGRLICMLGVCIECMSMQPEVSILAASLFDMLRSKQICNHPEAYVRRATLYAASRIMVSLHPAHVARAVSTGDFDIAGSLDWVHQWALQVAEHDSDTECTSMAMACLHLHSELVLQASRSMDSERAIGTSAGNIAYKSANANIISLR